MSIKPSDSYVREVKLRRDKIESFDAYPFSLPMVHHLDALDLHPAVAFINDPHQQLAKLLAS